MKASRFRSPLQRVVSSPVALVWLFAFALRSLYLWEISDAPFFDLRLGDAEAYHEWARRIADGDWLGTGVFYQAPLYPYFLALLYTAFGDSVVVVRIAQACLGATACAVLSAAGASLFGRAGVIAGLGLAVYPPAIYFDGLLDKTSLMTVLTSALLALVAGREEAVRQPALRWLATGIVLGLLTLTRENALMLAVPVLISALVASGFSRKDVAVDHVRRASRILPPNRRRQGFGVSAVALRAKAEGGRHASTRGLAFVIGLLIALLPVGLRNLARGGEFALTTAQLGPNLYIGNHSGASGTYEPLVVGHGSAADERDDATRLAQEAAGRQLSARDVSKYWTTRALAYIRGEPTAAFALFARKTAMTFIAAEITDTETQDVYAEASWLLRVLEPFDFGVLLGLAVFGIVLTASQWRRLWILYAIAITYALSVAIFYVLARYRFPLVPVLLLLAAGGFAAIGRAPPVRSVIAGTLALATAVVAHASIVDERGARAAHYAGIATALAQDPARFDRARHFYERALGEVPGHPATEFALATLLTRTGRNAEAIPHYRAALAIWPDHTEAHFNLGVALAAAGQSSEAADRFESAVRLRPDDAEAHLALAKTLVTLGRSLEAVPHYERALAIEPNNADAHNDLGTTLANEGRVAEALPHFQRATALDPNHERARQNLEQARRFVK